MSNPIPPFVCNTPPPIDCIVDAPPPVEDDFGDFAAVDDQFVASSLPVTPVHVAKIPNDTSNIPIPLDTPPSPAIELSFAPKDSAESPPPDHGTPEPDINPFQAPAASKIDLSNDLPYIIESNSPPPLDLLEPVEDDDLTPCDDLENDDEADEFPVDDVNKYDDNISLPSLKFDSLSNISKSTTPVSDELTKSNHEDSDSISAFQPIPTRELDGGANTASEENSTEETLPKEQHPPIDEAKAQAQTPSESENLESYSVIQPSSDDHESDFTEFETFSQMDDVKVALSEPIRDDFVAKDEPQTSDFVFEADFSQFSSFQPTVASQVIEPKALVEKSSLNDLEADDFDDFQDFAVATPVANVETTTIVQSSEGIPITHEDDDDFGEFSEVVETKTNSIPSSNSGFNLNNLNEKLKPILEMMFPLTDTSTQNDANEKELAVLTTSINQIDTAKALEYQWSNSEVRHSLIKSLGVDSRNILYGEKWNSSMPRFAANLTFNPLEPMKPDRIGSLTSSSASSSTSSTAVDHRKRSGSLTPTGASAGAVSKVDVPAVEFDWNSSGLVNPLDGVKEILHEGTIETFHPSQSGESNPPADQQSSAALSTTNNNIYDTDQPVRGFFNDETISTATESKSHADAPTTVSTTTIPIAAATAAAAAAPISTTPPAATAAPAPTNATALPNHYVDITGSEFPPSVLDPHLDTILANSPALNHTTTHPAKYQESSKTDLETELKHSGVVTTSTYAGPLKETHIFTPSKTDTILARSSSKTPRTSESKCPIDFDYEIAAAGIIIDEAVVKKEYRDVEYNPGFGSKYREDQDYNHISTLDNERDRPFSLNGPTKHSYLDDDFLAPTQPATEEPPELDDFCDFVSVASEKKPTNAKPIVPSTSFDDEFSDFQSVPAPVAPVVSLAPVPTIVPPPSIIPSSVANTIEPKSSPSHLRKVKESETFSSSGSRTGTPVSLNDEMILSPAILLPQAIQLEENKPKIDWPEPGINPEELARIEELFPQPKTANNINSNKPSPSHSARSQKLNHQQKQQNRTTPSQPIACADDDDWSDFVSVPAVGSRIQSISQQFQKSKASPAKSLPSDSNDDEWSDFVSSAPPPQQSSIANHLRPAASHFPQFNSGAWQNANFYNNPMSAYASPPTSFYYQLPQHQQQPPQNLSNNLVPNLSNVNNNPAANNNTSMMNNHTNSNNNNSINQYSFNNQSNPSQQHHNSHHHLQQHIEMMRDFSTSGRNMSTIQQQYAAMPMGAANHGYGHAGNRTGVGGLMQNHHGGKASQFGGGSSKVAPSISLIPDLGFVAPTHTSFISVPKSSFMAKK